MPALSSKPAKAAVAKHAGNESTTNGFSILEAFGHSSRVFDVSFCPITPSTFASASDDETVRVWTSNNHTNSCEQVGWFEGHSDPVLRVSWSPDASLLASGDSSGVVKLWQAPSKEHYTGRELTELGPHEEEVYSINFLSSEVPGSSSMAASEQLLVGSSTDLYLWDMESMTLLQQAAPVGSNPAAPEEMPPYVFGVAVQPGGRQLSVCCSDGVLRSWGIGQQHLEQLHHLNLSDGMLSCCAYSPDGDYVAVAGKGGRVQLVDVRQGEVLLHVDTGRPALSCSFIHMSGVLQLAVVGGDSCVRLLSFFNGPGVRKSEMRLPGSYCAPLMSIAAADGGACFAVAGEGMKVEELAGAGGRRGRRTTIVAAAALTNGMASLGLGGSDDTNDVSLSDDNDDEDMFQPLDALLQNSFTSDPTTELPPPAGQDSNCEHQEARRAPIFLWRPSEGR